MDKKIEKIFDKWADDLVEAGLREIERKNKIVFQARDFIKSYFEGYDEKAKYDTD